MEWIFMSDSAESVSLHDCGISGFVLGDDIEILFEDGFDVCADNPLNDMGRHKRTGQAAVVLKKGLFLSAEYPSYEDKKLGIIPAERIDLSELLPLDLEVYDFDHENGVFTLDCFADHHEKSFCTVKMSCAKLLFCWNEFTEDAWFQE